MCELLRREGRVSYRALRRQFDLDDAYLEDVQAEIIQANRLAMDAERAVLVWIGDAAPAPSRDQERAPLTYTPPHLAEKIRAAQSALQGERKQVTVLFADIKDSTELIRGLDPEAAQQLLDPAIHHMMDAVHRYEGTVNQVLGGGGGAPGSGALCRAAGGAGAGAAHSGAGPGRAETDRRGGGRAGGGEVAAVLRGQAAGAA